MRCKSLKARKQQGTKAMKHESSKAQCENNKAQKKQGTMRKQQGSRKTRHDNKCSKATKEKINTTTLRINMKHNPLCKILGFARRSHCNAVAPT
jgi:hypothetical protein